MRRKLCFHLSAVEMCDYFCLFTCNLVISYVPMIMYVWNISSHNLQLPATSHVAILKSGFNCHLSSLSIWIQESLTKRLHGVQCYFALHAGIPHIMSFP